MVADTSTLTCLAITHPSLGEDGLLPAEGTGEGEALRREVHREAVEAEGVKAGKHLKKKRHEMMRKQRTDTCHFSCLQHQVRHGGQFDTDAACVH